MLKASKVNRPLFFQYGFLILFFAGISFSYSCQNPSNMDTNANNEQKDKKLPEQFTIKLAGIEKLVAINARTKIMPLLFNVEYGIKNYSMDMIEGLVFTRNLSFDVPQIDQNIENIIGSIIKDDASLSMEKMEQIASLLGSQLREKSRVSGAVMMKGSETGKKFKLVPKAKVTPYEIMGNEIGVIKVWKIEASNTIETLDITSEYDL